MPHITLLNLTSEGLIFSPTGTGDAHVVEPSAEITIPWPKHCYNLSLVSPSYREKCSVHSVSVSIAFSTPWKLLTIPDDCSWRMYCSKMTQKHYRIIVLPQRNMNSFLSVMPDQSPLSSLLLPGTHETMAFYGWPVSQCQTLATPLDIQLQSGIRFIDVRLAIINSKLVAFHGIYPQRTPFQNILSTLHAFLTAPSSCRETVVVSIKQEDYANQSQVEFSQLVHQEMFAGDGGRDMWFLENRIPTLGEVRGKAILFSRFGGDGHGWEGGLEGLGIHPLTWPDSKKHGFTWNCKNTLVRTHDWYRIPSFLSIPEKVILATDILLPPVNNPPMPTLAITFFSAASAPLALPPLVAQGFGWPKWGIGFEGVNSRVGRWLLDQLADGGSNELDMDEKQDGHSEPRIRGWALLDFYADPEPGLVPLLVECNFRGRRTGEEGW